MANLKNALNELEKIYTDGVKKGDKKGLADIYTQATEQLFKDINEVYHNYPRYKGIEVTFEDVNYLDGYFIFGFGTNSVVNFHIKETPGWLYGIWWSPIPTEETENKKKKVYRTDVVNCNFFMQYEEEIDKFKPSASNYQFEFMVDLRDNGMPYFGGGFDDACASIAFIIKEPYLAFYKEMHYVDFNTEYVSREKAKRYWNKHWNDKRIEKELKKECANDMFNAIKTIIGKDVENNEAYIFDRGTWTSPRYEVVLKNVTLEDGNPICEEEGCYGLFGKTGIYDEEDEKLYRTTYKQCDKKCKGKTYFISPFGTGCMVYNTRFYNKVLKMCIEDNSLVYGIKDGKVYEGEIKADGED